MRRNLRRCANGGQFQDGTAHNTSISLYNNSPAEYLLVWDVTTGLIETDVLSLGYTQGAVGTLGPASAPLVPTDSLPPGLVYSGDSNPLPAALWGQLIADWGSGILWPHDYPIAVIPPLWSLLVVNDSNPTHNLYAGFLWEAINAEDFERYYGRFARPVLSDLG